MEIIRAQVLGFCFGVRRAVETAEKAVEGNIGSAKKIFTLGPLVHNPVVMDSLSQCGVQILDGSSFEMLGKDSVVVIRAHGTTPEVIDSLKKREVEILDATCPKVHLSQKRAREWSEKGYSVIIAGDKNHGEVVSISSYADDCRVIENAEEAASLDVPDLCVLIAQTTFSPVEFEKIKNILLSKNSNLVIFNSICSATMERQEALAELKGKSEGIIVIGGKNSANTKRLYESALAICPKSVLIEDADEIPEEFFIMKKVALTAGASTPDSTIERVEMFLKNEK
ncbi:4-hydroxy-3-methylbut-2-enyl diphosphate reductase [Treponema sp.]|uniref:4-hydroxy-3-methylbut-2-enyl diphosphate reductase n=1 Tax=Treponema sp. TaxID=166 RepID=UPI00298EBADC|nr:4-hydroxy-3-methylbut-2-enyl diphosphate reductase [Treponema sp.]MCQ2240724.1 4-hydroxy-3-methylbut-2-enyl diphosphate reductase [Treponema sp.]